LEKFLGKVSRWTLLAALSGELKLGKLTNSKPKIVEIHESSYEARNELNVISIELSILLTSATVLNSPETESGSPKKL
jgi:hypothetical protein